MADLVTIFVSTDLWSCLKASPPHCVFLNWDACGETGVSAKAAILAATHPTRHRTLRFRAGGLGRLVPTANAELYKRPARAGPNIGVGMLRSFVGDLTRLTRITRITRDHPAITRITGCESLCGQPDGEGCT